jgi:hypothetical protein
MKNTSRIRRKGGKRTASPQAAKKTSALSAEHIARKETINQIATNGADQARRPEFLQHGSLIMNTATEELWSTQNESLWLLPYPYKKDGERKVSYDEAAAWYDRNTKHKSVNAHRFLAEHFVFSGNPATREIEMQWAMKAKQGRLPLQNRCGGFNDSRDVSDEWVLDFICAVIAEFDDTLVAQAEQSFGQGDSHVGQLLQSVRVAVRSVNARARWYGLNNTPSDTTPLEEDEYRREPLFLDLPGAEGLCAYTDFDLLGHITAALSIYWRSWLDNVLPNLKNRKAVELAQALLLVEAFNHREGHATDLENLRDDELSPIQRSVEHLLRQEALTSSQVAA